MEAISSSGHRVRLRRACPADAQFLADWWDEPGMRTYLPGGFRPVEEIRARVEARSETAISPEADGPVEWIIEVNGEPAGRIRLTIDDHLHRIASIGYSLISAQRGKGAASTAVRLVTALAFDTNGFDVGRVDAVAAVENAASRRVLERAGFQFEGVLRGYLIIRGERVDHAIYDRLRSNEER